MSVKPDVLITGASSGIGADYADRFARRGHDLVLVARDVSRMEHLADTLRRETGVRVDVVRASPRLAAAGEGSIVNIGSIVGLAPEIGLTVYGATKAYVLFLSQGLHLELGPKGVHVQAVLPSVTRTEIWERSGRDLDALPAAMAAGELVDAALVGFDRRETVTIPPLPDASQWSALEAAR